MRHCQLHVLPQYDDWVDTVTQAMSWISTTHPLEFKDEDEEPVPESGSAFAFPDGHSALMLVAARLRHIAATKWGKRRYLVMDALLNPAKQEAAA